MSQTHPPAATYGSVAKFLHWLIVVLVAAQFVIATAMPDIHRGVVPHTLIKLHMSFGILILLVVIIRLLWRLGHPVAPAEDPTPPWQQMAARAVHHLLYTLLVALPILGWAAASARGWQIGFFGSFALPHLVSAKARIGFLAGDAHTVLAWAMLAVIGLHFAAALYHHFILRDGVLRRMWPGGN